jgi:hypothetical protein
MTVIPGLSAKVWAIPVTTAPSWALDVDLDDVDRRFADDGVDGGHLHDDPFAAPDLTGGDQSVPPGLGGVDRQLVLPDPVGARRLHHHHLAQPVAGDVVGEDRVGCAGSGSNAITRPVGPASRADKTVK